ncbi:hypothetical protein [Vibrio sp. D431a]|uniref:hypothetical protein n=1 Tax=Vibrio sp. D431a TaxID=2837388 RepID=UPI002554332B|nr:hypothetical protein [Vibrio sp. D431a]MDK9790666.1 hypothetical protein [Vibrio sp. D431a]
MKNIIKFKPWSETGIGGDVVYACAYAPYPNSITGEVSINVKPIEINKHANYKGKSYVRSDATGEIFPMVFDDTPCGRAQTHLNLFDTMEECINEYENKVKKHFNALSESLKRETELRVRGLREVSDILIEIRSNNLDGNA